MTVEFGAIDAAFTVTVFPAALPLRPVIAPAPLAVAETKVTVSKKDADSASVMTTS